MLKETLQKNLKAKLDEIEILDKTITDAPTAEQSAAYAQKVAEAKSIRAQLDQANAAAELKAWSKESSGSVVAQAATFSDNQLPGEGDMPGVSMTEKGELYALPSAGKSAEQKIAALKSGIYKDAFNEYVRNTGLNRPMGDAMKRVSEFHQSDLISDAYKGDAMKVLNEGQDNAGGYWLPPDYRPELVKRIMTITSVRPNATVYTTGSDHITFPKVTYTGASDDLLANLYTSGVRLSWRNSVPLTSDITEATNPIAGQINIPANLATAAIIVTREQLEDNSFDLLGYLTNIAAEAFGLGCEYAYTQGNGAGQPRGFKNHPAAAISSSTSSAVAGETYVGIAVQTSSTTAISWGTTTGYTGILGMEMQLPPQYEQNAKWYANKMTYGFIRAINAGTATLPQWAMGDAWPNYANGYGANLLGYPIVKNMFVDNNGTAGNIPLWLGDLHGYYIVDRVGLSVEVFREVYGLRDQVVIYMRQRTGGDLVQYWRMRCYAE
jgi:HK97 family phage major capsid protein